MSPSKTFVEDIKRIDEDLSVEWDNRVRRFVIYHTDRKRIKYPVIKVQYKDGSFKPLDNRTLEALKCSNRLRQRRPQEILYGIDKQNEEAEVNNLKRFENQSEAIGKYAMRKHLV